MASVGQHQVQTFPSPVRSIVPVDANRVRGNDNILAQAINAHDNDATLHLIDVRTVSTSQTLALTHVHTVILVNTSGGSVTLTLPTAASMAGDSVTVKKLTSAHTVTLDAAGSELIDGSLTLGWGAQHDFYTIVSDGAQWWIVGR
jgi:hypothetical protein